MADTTPAAAFTPSTSVVPPQNRIGHVTDYEHQVVLHHNGDADGATSWAPLRKVRITRLTLCNGEVAMAATTNTTTLDIDILDPSASTPKQHDVAAKAVDTAVAADAYLDLTLSTTEADLVMENDEMLKVDVAVAGTQGEFNVVVSYKYLDARDVPGNWPATPKG